MKDLILVTGPPGAGKSTVSELLAAAFPTSARVVGDDLFGFLRSGAVEPWRPEAHAQNTAVVEAAAAAAGRLARHCTVVYDGVIGPWFLDDFVESTGCTSLHHALLLPDLETCLERVRTRVDHDFRDLEAAQHMWQEFDGALAVRPGLREDVVGTSSEDGPAVTVAQILSSVATGRLRRPR